MAPTTKTRETSFPYLRLNSICEFLNWKSKPRGQADMTCLNFVASSWLSLKASTTNFESNSKSMLSKCISLIHRIQVPPPPSCKLHSPSSINWYLKANDYHESLLLPITTQQQQEHMQKNLFFNGCFHLQLNLISSFSFTFSLFFPFLCYTTIKNLVPFNVWSNKNMVKDFWPLVNILTYKSNKFL